MTYWTHYRQPDSVEGAIAALAEASGPVRLIAGGTDLLLDIQQGRHPPVDTLVDVTRIPELKVIRAQQASAFVGAAVTLVSLLEHSALQAGAGCLIEACRLIGGPQVRGVATLGGNVAHAMPAADGTIALLALDAQAQIASPSGRRWEPLAALFAGPGRSALDPRRELLVGFRFALSGPGEGSAFRRVMRPQGLAIAILNLGLWLRLGLDGTIRSARLAVGPGGPRPHCASRAGAALVGGRADELTVARATAALTDEVQLRSSPHRATVDYRRHLLPILMRRTLQAAYQAAQGQPLAAKAGGR